MAYSLTDATALGLDLARTPGGVEAAGVLLRGLLPAADVVPLPGPADLTHARARALAVLGPAAPTVLDLDSQDAAAPDAAAPDTVVQDTDAPDEPSPRVEGDATAAALAAADVLSVRLRRILRRLGAVSFGTVSELMTLALDLPLDPPLELPAGGLRLTTSLQRQRGEVLADGVLAALVAHRDDPAAPVLARALAHRLDPPGPQPPPFPILPEPGRALALADPGPLSATTSGLLVRLAAVPRPSVLLRPGGPAPHVWAEHMHSAAWAVQTTGRTRVAAVAQLELLRCLHAAGVDEAMHLAGVWNRCSAAVQAHVVADVVTSDTWTVLTANLLEALEV